MSAVPSVVDADVRDDTAWFGANPQRCYRARPGRSGAWWIVRRHGRVVLRTFAAALPNQPPGSERGLEELWYATAWPDLSPERRGRLASASRQSGGKR